MPAIPAAQPSRLLMAPSSIDTRHTNAEAEWPVMARMSRLRPDRPHANVAQMPLPARLHCPLCRISLLILIWPIAGRAQGAETLIVGKDAHGFHEEALQGMAVRVEPPAAVDAEIFVELVGLPNVAKINALRLQIRRSFGLNNAFAYFGENFRSIIYDPAWARSATAEFYLVLGHEAGHHVCGHSLPGFRSNPVQRELEADRFGGASIRRFEVYHGRKFFDDVLTAAARKYPQQGSSFYPSAAERLAAIKKGYGEGSPCGDLLPVEQRGFTSGPR